MSDCLDRCCGGAAGERFEDGDEIAEMCAGYEVPVLFYCGSNCSIDHVSSIDLFSVHACGTTNASVQSTRLANTRATDEMYVSSRHFQEGDNPNQMANKSLSSVCSEPGKS